MSRKIKGLWKKGNTFYYRYKVLGKTKYLSLEAGTEEGAIAELFRLKSNPITCQTESFMPTVDKYLSERVASKRLSPQLAQSRRYVLAGYAAESGIVSPDQVIPSSVQKWYQGLLKRGLVESTAQSYVYGLRAFFTWMMKTGRAARNPVKSVQLNRLPMSGRKNFVESKKIKALIDKAPDDDLRFVLYCGFHAGMRKLEIIEAVPAWFDLRQGVITIESTDFFEPKDRQRRTVPMTKPFQEFMKRYCLRSPYVLRPDVARGASKYRYDFRRPFDEYMAKKKVKCTVHDMRRSFASNLVIAGVDVFRVAKWLGDGVAVVQEHYAHLLPSDNQIDRGVV